VQEILTLRQLSLVCLSRPLAHRPELRFDGRFLLVQDQDFGDAPFQLAILVPGQLLGQVFHFDVRYNPPVLQSPAVAWIPPRRLGLGHGAAVDQGPHAADTHDTTPGPHADDGRQTLKLNRLGKDVTIRAGKLVGQHDEGAIQASVRVSSSPSPAGATEAHQRPAQPLEDLLGDRPATVPADIYYHALQMSLGIEPGVELHQAVGPHVGNVHVTDFAAGLFSHVLTVLAHPVTITQVGLARHRYHDDLDEVRESNFEDSEWSEADFTREELYSIIHRMPGGYRMVFNLYAVEGYKHREIAEILNIDISRALRLKGVKAVITAKETIGKMHGFVETPRYPPDQYPLATDRVRFVGEEVAAVAAIDSYVAEEALDLSCLANQIITSGKASLAILSESISLKISRTSTLEISINITKF